jgi:Fanconi anemia group M protein
VNKLFTIRKRAIQAQPIYGEPTGSAGSLVPRRLNSRAESGQRHEISVSGGFPIIPTAYEEETVSGIAAIARLEHQARGGAPQAHGKKTHRTLKERQEYLVSSIPGVGNAVAKNLLRHFGSVERVFAATEEELIMLCYDLRNFMALLRSKTS